MLFSAYIASQFLQSSIHGSAGITCLAVVYGLFAAAALFAPWAMGLLPPRMMMPLSAIPYVCFVGANIVPPTSGLIVACAAVGVAAATLWSAEGLYVSQAAVSYSKRTRTSLTDANTKLNSAFYTIFSSAGFASYILASLILLLVPAGGDVLFIVLTVCGGVGVILLCCLVEPAAIGLGSVTAPLFLSSKWLSHATPSVGVAPSAVFVDAAAAPATEGGVPAAAAPDAATPPLRFAVADAIHRSADSVPVETGADYTTRVASAVVSNGRHTSVVVNTAATAATVRDGGGASSEESSDAGAASKLLVIRPDAIGDDLTGSDAEVVSISPPERATAYAGDATLVLRKEATAAAPATVRKPFIFTGVGVGPARAPTVKTVLDSRTSNADTALDGGDTTSHAHSRCSSDSSGHRAGTGPPTLLYMLKFLLLERRMHLIAPIILYTGFSGGCFNGIWIGYLGGKGVGIQYVGFIGAMYAVSTAVFSYAWGTLWIPLPWVGRRAAFTAAMCAHLLFWVGSGVWALNYPFDSSSSASGSGSVTIASPGLERGLSFLFCGAIVCGFADAVWNSMIPATLQTFYSEGSDASCANASVRLYVSIGFAVQSAISASLSGAYIAEQMFAVAGFGVLAFLCLWHMHAHVCSVDIRIVAGEGSDSHVEDRTKGGPGGDSALDDEKCSSPQKCASAGAGSDCGDDAALSEAGRERQGPREGVNIDLQKIGVT